MGKLVVFTDLDGSLLNHEDYSCAAAAPSLARIKKGRIPLVFVTSKTRKEVELLQRALGIREPFIVENGGGIFFPVGYRGWRLDEGHQVEDCRCIELGVPYAAIRAFLSQFGQRFGIRGFGDWSVGEIALQTGLAEKEARLAAEREFTEPFVLEGDADMVALQTLVAVHGLKITRGGRFYHLIGIGQDKGLAVKRAQEILRRYLGRHLLTVGVGDSENDLPMLAQVDIPVVIPRPDGTRLDPRLPRAVFADAAGSKGWNGSMENILDEFTATAA